MSMFAGKKGLVLGVANENSIAWAIASEIMRQGGKIGFSHLPDRPDDERQRNRRRVSQLTDQHPESVLFLEPLDVQSDEQIASFMKMAGEKIGSFDFLCTVSRLPTGMTSIGQRLKRVVPDSNWPWISAPIV